MGQVILPTGGYATVEELRGTTDLNILISTIDSDATTSYRTAVIGLLSRMGKIALPAISKLTEIKNGNDKILKQAAEHAIKKIENNSSSAVVTPYSVLPVPPPYAHNHSHSHYKPSSYKVELVPLSKKLLEGCSILNNCPFCLKQHEITSQLNEFNLLITGKNNKYCQFCLREKYFQKEIAKDIIILTYKTLIAYIHYGFNGKNHIYGTESRDCISDHYIVGLANPLFKYDCDSFNWFIDLSLVNSGRISLKKIETTIASQLCALGIAEIFHRGNPQLIYRKIINSISNGEKFIIPMPSDGGVPAGKKIPGELLTEFTPFKINDHNDWKMK